MPTPLVAPRALCARLLYPYVGYRHLLYRVSIRNWNERPSAAHGRLRALHLDDCRISLTIPYAPGPTSAAAPRLSPSMPAGS